MATETNILSDSDELPRYLAAITGQVFGLMSYRRRWEIFDDLTPLAKFVVNQYGARQLRDAIFDSEDTTTEGILHRLRHLDGPPLMTARERAAREAAGLPL